MQGWHLFTTPTTSTLCRKLVHSYTPHSAHCCSRLADPKKVRNQLCVASQYIPKHCVTLIGDGSLPLVMVIIDEQFRMSSRICFKQTAIGLAMSAFNGFSVNLCNLAGKLKENRRNNEMDSTCRVFDNREYEYAK